MEAMQKIGLDGLLKDVTNVIGRNLLFNKILYHKIWSTEFFGGFALALVH